MMEMHGTMPLVSLETVTIATIISRASARNIVRLLKGCREAFTPELKTTDDGDELMLAEPIVGRALMILAMMITQLKIRMRRKKRMETKMRIMRKKISI